MRDGGKGRCDRAAHTAHSHGPPRVLAMLGRNGPRDTTVARTSTLVHERVRRRVTPRLRPPAVAAGWRAARLTHPAADDVSGLPLPRIRYAPTPATSPAAPRPPAPHVRRPGVPARRRTRPGPDRRSPGDGCRGHARRRPVPRAPALGHGPGRHPVGGQWSAGRGRRRGATRGRRPAAAGRSPTPGATRERVPDGVAARGARPRRHCRLGPNHAARRSLTGRRRCTRQSLHATCGPPARVGNGRDACTAGGSVDTPAPLRRGTRPPGRVPFGRPRAGAGASACPRYPWEGGSPPSALNRAPD